MFNRLLVAAVLAALTFLLPRPTQATVQTLSIPALNLDAPITTAYIREFPDGVTWDMGSIWGEVAYLDGTAAFGSGGNTVLGAHSETARRRPSLFYRLGDLQAGDAITVTINDAVYHYAVTEVRYVPITDLSVITSTSDERLTLITCTPSSYNAATGSYNLRTVVIAARAG